LGNLARPTSRNRFLMDRIQTSLWGSPSTNCPLSTYPLFARLLRKPRTTPKKGSFQSA
jgi:hypothetical protein